MDMPRLKGMHSLASLKAWSHSRAEATLDKNKQNKHRWVPLLGTTEEQTHPYPQQCSTPEKPSCPQREVSVATHKARSGWNKQWCKDWSLMWGPMTGRTILLCEKRQSSYGPALRLPSVSGLIVSLSPPSGLSFIDIVLSIWKWLYWLCWEPGSCLSTHIPPHREAPLHSGTNHHKLTFEVLTEALRKHCK